MTPDQFQARLRGLYDSMLARAAEQHAADTAALQALCAEAKAAETDEAALVAILLQEAARFMAAAIKDQQHSARQGYLQ